jgi:hypothetical protein
VNFEKEFQKINAKYPWLKEATLYNAVEVIGNDIKADTKLQEQFNKNKPDPQKFDNVTKSLMKDLVSKGNQQAKRLKSATRAALMIGRSSSPISSTATLVQSAGLAANRLGNGVANSSRTGLLGDVGGGSIAAFGIGAAAYSGAMIMYGKLMEEQEKASRAMINQGLLVTDVDLFTRMKNTFAEAGMSLNEGMESLGDLIPTFANLGDSSAKVITDFIQGLDTALDSDVIHKFGQRRNVVVRQVSETLTSLRNINSIDDLNQMSMNKVLDRYESNARIIFGVSQLMGVTADSERSSRMEASNNINFIVAMRNSQAAIIDRLGEIGYDNLQQAQSSFVSGLNYLGNEFSTLASNALNRAVYDYDTDTNFRNNIDTELNEVLNLLGPSARQSFIDLGQQLLDGELFGIELEIAKRDFFNTVRNSSDSPIANAQFQIPDGEIDIAREVYNRSFLIGDEFMNATDLELVELAAAGAALTDNADDALVVVDTLAIALRKVYNLMTPGFATTGQAMSYFNDNLQRLVGGTDSLLTALETTFSVEREGPPSVGSRGRNQRRGDRAGTTSTGDSTSPGSPTPSVGSRGRNQRRGDRAGTTSTGDSTSPRSPGNSNSTIVGGVTLYQGGEYGVNTTEGRSVLLDMSGGGASNMVRDGAQENLDRLLSGPYARMQEYYGGPLSINDAIAKHGTSREDTTPNSQHFFGNALDIGTHNMSNEDKARIVHAALRAGFTGFGFGAGILHVDVGRARSWSYNNSHYGGLPVSDWQSFVAGNAVAAIQEVELQGLQSEFASESQDQPTDETSDVIPDNPDSVEPGSPTQVIIPEGNGPPLSESQDSEELSTLDTSDINLRQIASARDDLYAEYWNPDTSTSRILEIERSLGRIESEYGDHISGMGFDITPGTGQQSYHLLDERLQERYEESLNNNDTETISIINSRIQDEIDRANITRTAWQSIFDAGANSRRISETV